MSAWYVMSSLGIYNIAPGQQDFQIGIPQFDKAVINLENGKKFSIINPGAGITRSNTGSTDHLSFDAVGIPGFQFIQDPLEYETRTHHSNMDTYDHLQIEDLQQAAAVIAGFV